MGRTAAYTGKVVTWDETVGSKTPMPLNLEGLKA